MFDFDVNEMIHAVLLLDLTFIPRFYLEFSLFKVQEFFGSCNEKLQMFWPCTPALQVSFDASCCAVSRFHDSEPIC